MKALPKYAINLLFDNLALELEENQFQELLSMVQNFTLYHRGSKVRQFKGDLFRGLTVL